MPDWENEAARLLSRTKFSAEEREEVARELAGYLEEVNNDARERDLDESAAAQPALTELHEDSRLGANLYRARREGNMNDRTRQLWLPGITLLFATAATLAAFQLAALWAYNAYAPTPHGNNFPGLMSWLMRHTSAALFVYLGWLYVLPFLGAFGAYWSRRAGSGRAMQVVSGLFPVTLFLAIFLGQHAVGREGTSLGFLAMDALPPAHIFFMFLSSSSSLFLSWVLIPGAALLLGVFPFLFTSRDSESVIAAN